MTDYHSGYLVTLDESIREDDAEATLTALRMVKGVTSVEPLIVQGWEKQMARTEVNQWWRARLRALLDDERERFEW